MTPQLSIRYCFNFDTVAVKPTFVAVSNTCKHIYMLSCAIFSDLPQIPKGTISLKLSTVPSGVVAYIFFFYYDHLSQNSFGPFKKSSVHERNYSVYSFCFDLHIISVQCFLKYTEEVLSKGLW